MNRTCLAVLSVMVLALTGCPPTLPPTTAGGGWILQTNYINQYSAGTAPGTEVSASWVSDLPNAAGDPTAFTVVTSTDTLAFAAILDGRVPAVWNGTWVQSISHPECNGYSTQLVPSYPGVTEEMTCIVEGVEGEIASYQFYPSPLALSAPPAVSTIIGQGFKTTYGMPVVQYFDHDGTLLEQKSATSVSSDGTTITAPTPNLSGVALGVYAGLLSNVNANGSYATLGAVSVTVQQNPPVSHPPPCSNSRTGCT
jgi:hypothetical protein